MTTFKSFGLPSFLNEALERMDIAIPTPIQEKAIPAGLEGHDILGSAQTGTGKTMAYLIPLITNLMKTERSTALIMAPTRELAAQIQDAARDLNGRKMNVVLLIGGDSMYKQLSALKRGPRLIVGTPGRINDHLTRGTLRLNETRFLVLDETDRMLDMGFTDVLKKIVHHLPKERQTFMFSATMPPSIKTLSMAYLTDPQHIAVGSTTQPVLKIKQEIVQTSSSDKFPCLIKELESREGSVIIFVKTKHGADRLAERLSRQDHQANAMHGDLKQRKREEVIKDFRNLTKRILVATDIAARGLDIPHIKHVINYDLPQCPEDYIHRIGRTGRAGMEGHALSLVSPEDGNKWRRIHNLIETGHDDPSLDAKSKSRNRTKQRPFQKSGPSDGRFGASKREDNKSGAGRHNERKFGSPKRDGDKPDASRHEERRFGAPKRDGNKPDASRHEERRFGAPKREGDKPGGSRHEGFKKSFSKRGPSKPTDARSEGSRPEGAQRPAAFKRAAPKRDTGGKRGPSQRAWA
ncbi:MAG: DEAD/DEAH box helicase [Alphaproteobacteria bacterium]|nr:DEAD/DEAH box helicase [Alphaproteobacteria bacterium]